MSLKRSLYFGTILTGLVCALPSAHADGVYLLQLGSFDTEAKAHARWASLQGKYPDALGNLSVRLMDVTLPPDNFKVFRTQAGAVSSRADAQSICDQLSARGDECYVVETAMFNEGSRANVPNPPLSLDGQAMSAPRSVAPVAAAVAKPAAPTVEAPVAAPAVTAKTPVQKAREMEKEAEEERGFWSSLNPFSEDAPKAPAKAAAVDDSYPSLQPSVELTAKAAPVAPAAAPRAVMAPAEPAPAPFSQPVVSAPPAPPFMAPPAPQGNAMQAVAQQRLAAEQRAGVTTSYPSAQPFQPQSFGVNPAPQPSLSGSGDDVAVAEAIRVPLTEQQAPSAFAYPSTQQLQQLGMPSQESGEKTLWAQVSYFDDQQSALGFWENYRATNRDLPPVRVRVTSPYMATRGVSRVSLRVGPFEKAGHVNHFCSTIQSDGDLKCSINADIGSSGAARFDRSNAMPESRYVQRQGRSAAPMHWVQLGTYGSVGEANGEWSSISTMQRPLLDSLQANIAPPAMGSSTAPRYRLRTGPYMTRMAADELCGKLRSRGTQCVVTFGR